MIQDVRKQSKSISITRLSLSLSVSQIDIKSVSQILIFRKWTTSFKGEQELVCKNLMFAIRVEKWWMVVSVERGRRAFNRIKVRKRAATQKLDVMKTYPSGLGWLLTWDESRLAEKEGPSKKEQKSDDLSDTGAIFFLPLLFPLSDHQRAIPWKTFRRVILRTIYHKKKERKKTNFFSRFID